MSPENFENTTRLANVRFVGSKPPAELPRYLKMFDVGIIPYKGEEFLKGCQPTKTFEYLAAGLGVVSAPIPELVPYAEVVRFAANATEFIHQTREMLKIVNGSEFRSRCVEIARGQTWDARIEAASGLVRASLARKAGVATISVKPNESCRDPQALWHRAARGPSPAPGPPRRYAPGPFGAES